MKAKAVVSLIVGLLLSLGTITITTDAGQYAEKICPECSQISKDLQDKGFPLKFIEENTRVDESGSTIETFTQTNIVQFIVNWLLWSAIVFVAINVLVILAEALSMMVASLMGVLLIGAYLIFLYVK